MICVSYLRSIPTTITMDDARKRSPFGAPNSTTFVATRHRTHLLERPELTGGQAAPSDVLFP